MERYEIEQLLEYSANIPAETMELLANQAGLALFQIDALTGDVSLTRNTTLLTGYQPGELPHSENTKSMLTFEDDRPRIEACMRALLSGEEDSYRLEYRIRRKDGSIVPVLETATVSRRDEAGRPLAVAGITQDLSRLRWAEDKARQMEQENRRLAKGATAGELAEQNRMLRAANSAAAMIIGGFHQDYETVLRQSLQILGESVQADRAYIWRNTEQDGRLCCFQRAEWTRVSPSTPVPQEQAIAYDDFLPHWRDMLQRRTVVMTQLNAGEWGLQAFPGVEGVKAFMVLPLFLHGEFWGFVGFDDCTSERVFSDDEGEIMTAGALVIASSVSRNETFGKLNEAREAAMASTRAKGEFLSRMSHEIRTPMNAVIGMTTIAKRTNDPEKIKYCLEKVDASARQLLGIINDVLDMSKIDANKLEITRAPFDFEKMVQNVFNVVQVKLEEKHQDFHLDFDGAFTRNVVSDELRLSQVLINLLNNAMKFTPECGLITLKVRTQPQDEDHALLRAEVVDTGIGIEPETQKRLFQSFEQGDGGITRQYGGTGLGLAISKKIVDLLDGQIWVESAPGEGSHFIFEIPVAYGGALETPPQPLQADVEALRVLVVDDSPDVLEYFTNILSGFNIDCDTAAGGGEAMALVRQSLAEKNPYDIIFIDWNMPGLNGGATATGIRELMGDDALVVMISVSDWADIEADATKTGVQNFLAKPVLPSTLYNTIVRLTHNSLVDERPADPAAVPDLTGKTILLAEDIEINREIVASVMEDTHATMVYAEDGEQAVAVFAHDPQRFDLILMDVQMPRLDGMDATQKIRALADPWAQQVPILAMTANAFKEDEQAALDAGMNGHLAKPLDFELLYKTLEQWLKK